MKIHIYALRPKKTWYPMIVSWIIMWYQKTKYSHMAIGYESITGNHKVADSRWPNGVSDMLDERFFKKYDTVNWIIIDVPVSDYEFLEWLEEQEGKTYPFYQLFGQLFFGKKNTFGGGFTALTCNELPLSLLERFKGLQISDSDNYDLNMTWSVCNDFSVFKR